MAVCSARRSAETGLYASLVASSASSDHKPTLGRTATSHINGRGGHVRGLEGRADHEQWHDEYHRRVTEAAERLAEVESASVTIPTGMRFILPQFP
jgi:hypothetical protein